MTKRRSIWRTIRLALPSSGRGPAEEAELAMAAELEPARSDPRFVAPEPPPGAGEEDQPPEAPHDYREPQRRDRPPTPRRPTPARWVDRIPLRRRFRKGGR
jgi:hypothetical protein